MSSYAATFSDRRVEVEVPKSTRILEKQKCDKAKIRQIPRALTNFRCSKVVHSSGEFLILQNTESGRSRSWQYKIFTNSEFLKDLGNIDAEYTVIPVEMEGSGLEFVAINIDKDSFRKADRKISIERFSVHNNQLSPVRSDTSNRSNSNMGIEKAGGGSSEKSYVGVEIADAFHKNPIEAIKKYSTQSKIRIEADSIAVQSGSVIIRDIQRPSAVQSNVDEMGEKFSWNRWMDATSGKNSVTKNYDIRCYVSMDTFSKLSVEEGDRITLLGKLRDYSGETVSFDCTSI